MRKEDKQWLELLYSNISEISKVIQSNIAHLKKYIEDLAAGKDIKLSLLNSEVLFLDVNDSYIKARTERDKTGRIIKLFPKTKELDPEILNILEAAKEFKKEKNELVLQLDVVRRKISRKLERVKKKKRVYRIKTNEVNTIFKTEDPANNNKETYEFYVKEMLYINVKMLTKIFLLQRLYYNKLKKETK